MTGYGRISLLGALLGLAGCSHNGESEAARGAGDVSGQVGAVVGEAAAEEAPSHVRQIRPPEDVPPRDDVFNGARYFQCSNGQSFAIDVTEGEDEGLVVTKAGEEYFLPRIARDRFSGDSGELMVTSPSQTSLALADQQELRSCVRTPTHG